MARRRRSAAARPRGSHRRALLAFGAGIVVMLAAGAGLVVFTADRLLRHREMERSSEALAACLDENAAGNLTIEAGALIEHACRAWVRDRTPAASCVLRRHGEMTGEVATKAVEKACGMALPEL
jgi:hypothetical protein